MCRISLIKREKRNQLFRHRVWSFLLLFSQTTTKSGEKLSYYRLVRLHVTGEGQEITHALADTATVFNQRLLQGFSQEELELLFQQFARIRANALSIRGEIPHLEASKALLPSSGPSTSEE